MPLPLGPQALPICLAVLTAGGRLVYLHPTTPHTPPTAAPRPAPGLHLPHGLQRGPATVAAPCTPLPAQGHLQGQGQPQQCWKGRPYPESAVTQGWDEVGVSGHELGGESRW